MVQLLHHLPPLLKPTMLLVAIFHSSLRVYVVWKSHILPAIIGCNMNIFIDGTVTPPPTTIVETSNVAGRTVEHLVPNPEYRLWRRLDQALLAWILSLVSKDIRTQVSKVSVTFTSHQLWSSLERLFGSHCKAKLMQLCMQFQTTKKDSLSISSYFCKMKEIADTLTMAGSTVFDWDFILQVLSSLLLEYYAVITSINSSQTIMTVEEVQSLLLN